MPVQTISGIPGDGGRDMDVGIRDYVAEARLEVQLSRAHAVLTGVTDSPGPQDAEAEQYRQQYPDGIEDISVAMGARGAAPILEDHLVVDHDMAPGAVYAVTVADEAVAWDEDNIRAASARLFTPRRRSRSPQGLVNIWVTIREATSENVSVRIGSDLYPMEREDALSFSRSDFESWFQERVAHMEWPPEDAFDWAESQVRAREDAYRVVKERAGE